MFKQSIALQAQEIKSKYSTFPTSESGKSLVFCKTLYSKYPVPNILKCSYSVSGRFIRISVQEEEESESPNPPI
jgi:hypothetical protein